MNDRNPIRCAWAHWLAGSLVGWLVAWAAYELVAFIAAR